LLMPHVLIVIVLPFPATTGLQAPFVWTDGGLGCAIASPQNRKSSAIGFIAPCYHLLVFDAAFFAASSQFVVTVFPEPCVTGLHGASVEIGPAGGSGAGAFIVVRPFSYC
jgi:hypothetical protein